MCLSCPVTAPIFTPPGEHYLNGLRLLRLVRLRREFRTLWQLSLLCVPVWLGVVIWVQAVTPSDSTLWNLADEYATAGFVVLGGLVVIGILGMIAIRVAAGVPGQVAAAFVPVAARGREATVEGDEDALSGLLPRLRRQQWVSAGVILLFVAFTGVGIVVGLNLAPVYEANQGQGGPIVTIGVDATVSGYQTSGRSRNYYLSTPDGTVIAEDGKPANGERWLIYHNPYGNDEAYLVGGHEYLLLGGILLVVTILDAAVLLAMTRSVRRERMLRQAGGHQPLAYSVRKLAAGARPVLSFGVAKSVTVGLPPLPEDSDLAAEALLRRRRTRTAVAIGVVVIVVVGTSELIAKVTQPAPPTTKDVTLPYLSATGWSQNVEVFYADTEPIRDVTVDMLQAGGVPGKPTVGPIWSLVVSTGGSNGATANIDVIGIGSVAGRQAVAGGVAFEKEVADDGAPPPVEITGLPAGWSGIVTDGKAGLIARTANIFGSANGTMVAISITSAASGATLDTDLATKSRALATTIATRGIPQFTADTAQ